MKFFCANVLEELLKISIRVRVVPPEVDVEILLYLVLVQCEQPQCGTNLIVGRVCEVKDKIDIARILFSCRVAAVHEVGQGDSMVVAKPS